MEGIDFSNSTSSENNAGDRLDAGYWVNSHIGIAVGADRSETRRRSRPRASFRHGRHPVLEGGVRHARFYQPGRETQSRVLHRTGASFLYGIGASWNIRGNWHLRADAEMMTIDVADIRTVTLGIEYRLKN